MNPGETCLLASSGELVLRKNSGLLGPRVSGAKVVSRASEGMREPQIYDSLLARILNQVVVYVCERDRRCV